MGVDHTVSIGYGQRITHEELEAYVKRLNPDIDPDDLDIDPDDEFWKLTRDYPLVGYIVAGSYYDSDPVEYALVVKSTKNAAGDLAGFLNIGRTKITAEEGSQLRMALSRVFGYDHKASLSWQVGGLWS